MRFVGFMFMVLHFFRFRFVAGLADHGADNGIDEELFATAPG